MENQTRFTMKRTKGKWEVWTKHGLYMVSESLKNCIRWIIKYREQEN